MSYYIGLPWLISFKESAWSADHVLANNLLANAVDTKDVRSTLGSGRSPATCSSIVA